VVQASRESASAKSLALVRPREVTGLVIEDHPGWTGDQQRKIDKYVSQERLFDEHDRSPLEAPRFQSWYQYSCHEPACRGHRQGILDWEFVALQRRVAHLSRDKAVDALRDRFLDMMCAPKRNPAFYVGNQAKRAHVFSVLGVYYPER
jgi:hypothetical protein